MKAGWQVKKLGEVCHFENGDRGTNYPSRSARTAEGIPFINAGHLTEDGIDVNGLDYISRERFDLLSNGKIRNGDVLFCLRGSLGKFASVSSLSEGAIASSLVIVRPGDSILQKYLLAYFGSHLSSEQILSFKNGAAQPNLSAGSLSKFSIPLPPLPEQQRIVAILDEAFDGIAVAKVNAEQNLKNARELFDSYLQAVFTQRGDGWMEKTIEQCFKVRSGEFLPAKKMNINGDVDVYGGNGVTGKHDLSNITGENIVIGRVGAKCGNIRHVQGDIWLTDNAFYICEFIENFDMKFLTYLLELKNLRSVANQMAQPVISYTTIKGILLSFPSSLSEQHSIVAKLDALSTEIQSLEAIYQQIIASLDELKQSLLHRAFAGEL